MWKLYEAYGRNFTGTTNILDRKLRTSLLDAGAAPITGLGAAVQFGGCSEIILVNHDFFFISRNCRWIMVNEHLLE